MGRLREGLKKLVTGGPEHQARKEEKRQIEKELKQREDQAFYEGLKKGRVAGAKARGYRQGKAQASGGGGITGFFNRLDAGAKSLEKGGGALIGDVDFGNMGKGLEFPGFGSEPRKRRSKPRKKARKR